MSRTTLDIDGKVLEAVKRLSRERGHSVGQVASELLAEALVARGKGERTPGRLQWRSQPMHARLDLEDREAVFAILDSDSREA